MILSEYDARGIFLINHHISSISCAPLWYNFRHTWSHAKAQNISEDACHAHVRHPLYFVLFVVKS